MGKMGPQTGTGVTKILRRPAATGVRGGGRDRLTGGRPGVATSPRGAGAGLRGFVSGSPSPPCAPSFRMSFSSTPTVPSPSDPWKRALGRPASVSMNAARAAPCAAP